MKARPSSDGHGDPSVNRAQRFFMSSSRMTRRNPAPGLLFFE